MIIMSPKVQSVIMNNSRSIPILGLGTWKSKPGEVTQAVKDAIDAGYRHIDCAFAYNNEAEVGEALKAKMTDGTVKREELFITSKLWNTYHRKELVVPSLKTSLTKLGLSYLDLYLIHWPMGYKEGEEMFPTDADGKTLYSSEDYLDTWCGMEDGLKQGLTMSIGVSNFNKEQIERISTDGHTVPANVQVECHPYLLQDKLIEYCRSKGITVTAYSPLGSPDRPWAKPEDPVLMEEPKIIAIAKKHDKTPAQILIKFQVQRGVICIPKSVTKERIISNFQVWDFELSSEDLKTIASFDCNGRALHLSWVNDHPMFPFNAEF